MKRVYSYCSLIITIILIEGCTKHDEVPLCYMTADGTFTFTYTNNKLSAGKDGLGDYTIKYDQEGRPIEYDYTAGYTIVGNFDLNNRLINETTTFKGAIIQKDRYKYNSFGQLTVYNSTIIGDPSLDSIIYVYAYPNTSTYNITSISQTQYSSNHTGNPNVIIYPTFLIISSFEYDNMLNPYTVLHPVNPLLSTDNNITKKITVIEQFSSTALVTTHSYTYNAKGYPLTVNTTSPNPNGSGALVTTTTNFTYSNCQ